MTPILNNLFVVAVVFAAAELLLTLWCRRRRLFYHRIARTERIRLQIGDARCRLVTLTAAGQLSPETVTFRDLYFVQTAMMRGTDQYAAFSEAMWRKVLSFEQVKQGQLQKEAEGWSPEVREIAMQTADAIREIWLWNMPFSMLLRVVKHVLVRIGIVSYERVERWCDNVLATLVSLADHAAAVVRQPHVGTEMRLAAEMRQTEQILRQAMRRAA